jgi:hypothetical protein
MSEWWTYRLSDFLSFAPQTYYRLFELYNAAIWPGQIVALLAGVAILALLRRAGPQPGRLVAGILAVCWLWIAIAFHANRYASINFPAIYFAWGFGVEAALLICVGVVRGRLAFGPSGGRSGRVGLWIFLFALLLQPVIGLLLGRSWRQVELFGLAPDPTAVATLGILLRGEGRTRWKPMIVPVLWCAITGATLWTMRAPDFWIAPAAALLAVVLAAWNARSVRRLRPAST